MIEKRISKSISAMRVVAMLYIAIILHYLPRYSESATIVHLIGELFSFIGVGTFFAISGFLFGCQDCSHERFSKQDNFIWLRKRAIRILIAYEIVVVAVVVVQILAGNKISLINTFSQVFNLQGIVQLKYAFAELGHTWYLSIMMVCYLITPVLRKIHTKRCQAVAVAIFCIVIFTFSFLTTITSASYTGSVMCYTIMYFVGRRKCIYKVEKMPKKAVGTLITVMCIRLICWYLFDETWFYNIVVVLAGTIEVYSYFYIGLWFWSNMQKMKIWIVLEKLIQHLNDISYEYYLVHAVLIS